MPHWNFDLSQCWAGGELTWRQFWLGGEGSTASVFFFLLLVICMRMCGSCVCMSAERRELNFLNSELNFFFFKFSFLERVRTERVGNSLSNTPKGEKKEGLRLVCQFAAPPIFIFLLLQSHSPPKKKNFKNKYA